MDNKKIEDKKIDSAKQNEDREQEQKTENKEIEQLKQKLADFENNYKRALADYQNLEKRTRDDRRNWIALANKGLILRLLPILDTLVMAAKHVENQGLTLSIQQFLQALQDEGVKRIETKGKEFDPHKMEGIEIVEGEAEGKVLDEVRAGYEMDGKVIRPAQVKVGKGK